MEEIKIPKRWIDRLGYYILRVENSQNIHEKDEAVAALLGYLGSLEHLSPIKDK